MALKKSQKSLKNWTKQKWRTKSGKPSAKTGERYLPDKAIKALTSAEYAATTKAKSPAWTRKEGKNPKGGLNAKGRASYNKGKTKTGKKRNLKAPSKKVGNPRRASFCARMKGMKKKLTSAKTARDPNSRINKSLRAWNC